MPPEPNRVWTSNSPSFVPLGSVAPRAADERRKLERASSLEERRDSTSSRKFRSLEQARSRNAERCSGGSSSASLSTFLTCCQRSGVIFRQSCLSRDVTKLLR